MNTDFETELVRNTTLGAVALWRFARSWVDQAGRDSAPPLTALMLVMPMVCHEATVKAIANRNRDGAFLKAIAEDRTVALGLQRRMESFAPRTFRSLNLAVAANLLTLDRADGIRVKPIRAVQPFEFQSSDATDAIKAADRLGHSLSLTGLETAYSLLGVRF